MHALKQEQCHDACTVSCMEALIITGEGTRVTDMGQGRSEPTRPTRWVQMPQASG